MELFRALELLQNQNVRLACSAHSIAGARGASVFTRAYEHGLVSVRRKFQGQVSTNVVHAPAAMLTPSPFTRAATIILPLRDRQVLHVLGEVDAAHQVTQLEDIGVLAREGPFVHNPAFTTNAAKAVEVLSGVSEQTAISAELALERIMSAPGGFAPDSELRRAFEDNDESASLANDLKKALPIQEFTKEGRRYLVPAPQYGSPGIKDRHFDLLWELEHDPLGRLEVTALLSEPGAPSVLFEEYPDFVPDETLDRMGRARQDLTGINVLDRRRDHATTLDGERLLCLTYGTPFAGHGYTDIYAGVRPPDGKPNVPDVWGRMMTYVTEGAIWKALQDHVKPEASNDPAKRARARDAFSDMFRVSLYDVADRLGVHPSVIPRIARQLRAQGIGAEAPSLYSHPRLYKKEPA